VQSDYAWPTLCFAALTVLSIAADWKNHRRRDADRERGRITWVPWSLLAVLSLLLTAVFAAWWLRGE
jgi:hypothetical protein